MKYVSIDIETTGIDSEQDEILSIGLVIEDTLIDTPIDELPSLHLMIIRDRLKGNVFALDMNRDIVKLLRDYQVANKEARVLLGETHGVKFVDETEVVEEIFDFLYLNNMVNSKWYSLEFGKHMKMKDGNMIPILGMKPHQTTITAAGKNFGTFDKLFIEKLPRWNRFFRFRQRILDPAILFTDWKEDSELPNLSTCLKRAGFNDVVTHDAVDDAKDVIRVLRTKY